MTRRPASLSSSWVCAALATLMSAGACHKAAAPDAQIQSPQVEPAATPADASDPASESSPAAATGPHESADPQPDAGPTSADAELPTWRVLKQLAQDSGLADSVGLGPRYRLPDKRVAFVVASATKMHSSDGLELRLLVVELGAAPTLRASVQIFELTQDALTDTYQATLAQREDAPDEVGPPTFAQLAKAFTVSIKDEDVDGDGRSEALVRFAWQENCPGAGISELRNMAIVDLGNAPHVQAEIGIDFAITSHALTKVNFVASADGPHQDMVLDTHDEYDNSRTRSEHRYVAGSDSYAPAPAYHMCSRPH